MIQVTPVATAGDLKRFIAFPDRLHADDPTYIAPLHLERKDALSAKSNPFFKHADVQFWLAEKDGRTVGRISAQRDRRQPEGIGHFGLIAAEDDPEIYRALFSTAEAWLRERGAREVLGPFNLSINEEVGVLVDGFDTPPMMMMSHDLPSTGPRIEEQGFEKAMDLFAYRYRKGEPFPKGVARIMAKPLPPNVHLRSLDMKRYDEEIRTVVDIFNDAWSENWGFLPFGEDEMAHLAKSMKLLVEPKLVWIAEVDGRAQAFGVLLPNLNEAIRDLKGKLFPFGWVKLLWRIKTHRITTGRVLLMGVRKEITNTMLGHSLPFWINEQFRREGIALGMEAVEMSWVLETNKPMSHMGAVLGGGGPYKTYRIYRKVLA